MINPAPAPEKAPEIEKLPPNCTRSKNGNIIRDMREVK